jgi:hypothetical protein
MENGINAALYGGRLMAGLEARVTFIIFSIVVIAVT